MEALTKQARPGGGAIDWIARQETPHYRQSLIGKAPPAHPTKAVLPALAARRHAHADRRYGITAPYIESCHIATDTPALYIARLCQQFEHKLAVNYDPQQGRIAFDFGLALLHADSSGLHMVTLSHAQKDLDKLKHMIGSHFERFVWQAPLHLDWQ